MQHDCTISSVLIVGLAVIIIIIIIIVIGEMEAGLYSLHFHMYEFKNMAISRNSPRVGLLL